MRTKLVRIGNSRGIRIPKLLLEESGLDGEVEIVVEGNALLVSPARAPRAGWGESFDAMARRGDDALLDADAASVSGFDEEEWEWR